MNSKNKNLLYFQNVNYVFFNNLILYLFYSSKLYENTDTNIHSLFHKFFSQESLFSKWFCFIQTKHYFFTLKPKYFILFSDKYTELPFFLPIQSNK